MIRNLVIAAIVLGVAFSLVRGKMRKSEEDALRIQDEAYRKSAEIARQRNDELQRQMEQRFMTSVNCDTALQNRQVLKDAAGSNAQVISFGGGKSRTLTAAEIPAEQAATDRYIEENCKNR